MDANKAGVVIPGADNGDHKETVVENEDQHSKDGAGTGDDAAKSQDKKEGEDNVDDKKKEEEAGAGDPKDKRINNLMSKWQGEEASHKKTKTELEQYKEKFGALDGEGKPTSKAKQKIVPEITEDDPDLPDSLKPGWAPKTMADLQEGLKQAALYGAQIADRNISERSQSVEQERKDAEQKINDFVTEIKEVDPEFDEDVFFKYANENDFSINSVKDLRAIYKSFVSLERAKRGAVETALKNKNNRVNPVNKPGSGQPGTGGVPFSKISKATSAKDLISDMIASNKK
jgi:hypothetical protein